MEADKQLDEGPERFDPVLLTQPKASRLAWFEKECTIEHTNLLHARDAILQTICSPGEGPSSNRLGTMVSTPAYFCARIILTPPDHIPFPSYD